MTKDEIILLAKRQGWNVEHQQTNEMLVKLIQEAIVIERTGCAKIVEQGIKNDPKLGIRTAQNLIALMWSRP